MNKDQKFELLGGEMVPRDELGIDLTATESTNGLSGAFRSIGRFALHPVEGTRQFLAELTEAVGNVSGPPPHQ